MYEIKACTILEGVMPEGLKALHVVAGVISPIEYFDEAEHYCRDINELSAYMGYGQPFRVLKH